MDWWPLLYALGIGLPLLLGALWLDLRRRRADEGKTIKEPDVAVDWIPQSAIDSMPLPASPGTAEAPSGGISFGFGHLGAEFATDGDTCELSEPNIILIDGAIETMRELVTPVGQLQPLVIVATGFHKDVIETLKANRKALELALVAVEATSEQIVELAETLGQDELAVSDLRAGYLPATAIGHASTWWSTRTASIVTPATSHKGTSSS